ncbi:biotin--[acetyl-CoA-carboxylase] ligase [Lentiprolixibacter aurantiacus]|uniref:Biotin--[acetyl-CoA-carboxylase] ligase n=1 Tax=Lentiprolixibacter aurantiacus TaxID=2993939 RepID=A0AAE3ML35_9FLAO|nr:biotin--[acetyl-CoA-carboxylase] ligase [Lentiprolixibacter aurantiacus]MCX2719286.1 biotin--[acetyl-CoA-carboxylase] ligase [Lentiprolixibacter aurantiacus]
MLLIKLDATDSTNAYLKDLLVKQNPPDGTVVQADCQKKGRGQLGREWISDPGKNLTISILKRFDQLKASDQFAISISTSLAIVEVLKRYEVPDIRVKWPNDILSGKQKLCGILVENIVKGAYLKAAVIGIGLNVNQDQFPPGLKATSISLQIGKELPLENVLKDLTGALERQINKFLSGPVENAQVSYEEMLYGKGERMLFSTPLGDSFSGVIQGIDTIGRLVVKRDSGTEDTYGLNEIRMVL